MLRRYQLLYAVLLFGSLGCIDMKSESYDKEFSPAIKDSTWGTLSEKKIYFGHQSVGNNIVSGINLLIVETGKPRLNIIETKDAAAMKSPMFAHSSIGKNDYPETKIAAFSEILDSGVGNEVNIAFFKFCFWDIRGKSNVAKIFDSYRTTMTELRNKYPRVQFIHLTVPLMSCQKGPTAKFKRLLNMELAPDIDNIRRNELNDLILKEYKGKEPIFDITEIEASLPDGSYSSFSSYGKSYYCMADTYTSDGGHLNEIGQRRVAGKLLEFLAEIAGK